MTALADWVRCQNFTQPASPQQRFFEVALTTQDGVNEVFKVLQAHGRASLLPSLIAAARCADVSAYMQCWTRTPEHNLMWERYAEEDTGSGKTSKNAVRIKMAHTWHNDMPGWISFHNVRYDDDFNVLKEVEAVLQDGVIDFRQSFTLKRKAYQHENEVRVMTTIHNDPIQALSGDRSPPPWWNNPRGDRDLTLIPIGSMKNAVASVMTGPSADDQLQRDVEAFCKKHHLLYEGRLDLREARFIGTSRIFKSDPL